MGYTPANYGGYERAKGNVDYEYSTNSATNAFGRFLSQQRGQRSLGDQKRNFGRAYPKYGAQFNQRGLASAGVTSGVQQQAMRRFTGDYAREATRTQQDMTQGLQQYDLQQNRTDAWKQQQYAEIEAAKADEIANAAQNIQYLRDLIGGLS